MAMGKPPRGTFWIGGAVGLALGLPLLSLMLLLAARVLAVGDPTNGLDRIGRMALAFAGFPAFLTGGGVARLAAYRPRALLAGTLAMGAAGIGLAYLTAVPLGGMPEDPIRWAWLALAGLTSGAVTGLAIAGLVETRHRRLSAPKPLPAPVPVEAEPEPEPEPVAEPAPLVAQPEPEPEREPQPKPEPQREPEPQPEPEPQREPEPKPEPVVVDVAPAEPHRKHVKRRGKKKRRSKKKHR